jgi:hypothetical protein
MKWLFIAAGLAFSPAAPAADAIYLSPDGVLQFSYSRSLVWGHGAAGGDHWEPLALSRVL